MSDAQGKVDHSTQILLSWLPLIAVTGILSIIATYRLSLFHLFTESFILVIAGALFGVAWHTRKTTSGTFVGLLGIVFAFVGLLDYFHAVSFPGTDLLPGHSPDHSIKLRLSARNLQALALFLAPFFAGRKVNLGLVTIATIAVASFLSILTFSPMLPSFYSETSITPFSSFLGQTSALVLYLLALLHLRSKRTRLSEPIWRGLSLSVLITIIAESLFLVFGSFSSAAYIVAPLLHLVSFFLVYRVLLLETNSFPQTAFIRTLQEKQELLDAAHGRLEEQRLRLDVSSRQQTHDSMRCEEIQSDLHRSENLFRSFVAESRDGVILLDTRGRVVEWNPSQCTITGISKERVLHKPFWHVLWQLSRQAEREDTGAESLDAIKTATEQLISTGSAPLFERKYEFRIRREDGEERYLELSVFTIPGSHNVSAAVMTRDATLEKRTEKELINLAKFPAENPHPVLRSTPEGKLLYSNDASGVLLRYWHSSAFEQLPGELTESISQAWEEDETRQFDLELENRAYAFSIVPLREFGYVNLYGRDISERVAFERRLFSSEYKYRHLVDSINEGIWVIDRNGETLYANAKLSHMLGYNPAETTSVTMADIIDPVSRDLLHSTLNDPEAPGSRQLEARMVCRNGTLRYALIELSFMADAHGGRSGVIAAVLDITGRKNAEILNTTMSEINATLISSRPMNQILPAILQKSSEALGASSAAILFKNKTTWTVQNVWGPQQSFLCNSIRDSEFPGCIGASQTGQPIMIEEVSQQGFTNDIVLRTGAKASLASFPIHVSGYSDCFLLFVLETSPSSLTSYQTAFGKSLATSISLALKSSRLWEKLKNELSERTRIQLDLVETQQKLQTLVTWQQHELVDTKKSLFREAGHRAEVEKELGQRHQALEAVYSMATGFGTSLDAMYDQIAMSIANILDMPHVSIRDLHDGRTTVVSQVIHGKLASTHEHGQCHGCPTPGSLSELQRYRGNLSEKFRQCACFQDSNYQSYMGIPIRSASGDTVGNICAMDLQERDFSDYESHLIEIFARYVGHEISRSVLEVQLRQSQEMKLLGHLTSGVAHEVRNPLNGILAITEALHQDLGERDEFIPYLEHMSNQVNRLSRLMEDLLVLGRPIAKKSMLPVRLAVLVQDSVRNWQQSHPVDQTRVNLHVHDSCEMVEMLGDAIRIEQVIVNLLENARQHSSPDSTIEVDVAPHESGRFHIRIKDQGPGVSDLNLSRIFEPFYTTRKSGTGLGLSIVRHIVESHGGHITMMNNTPPPGLTAEMTFPILDYSDIEKSGKLIAEERPWT